MVSVTPASIPMIHWGQRNPYAIIRFRCCNIFETSPLASKSQPNHFIFKPRARAADTEETIQRGWTTFLPHRHCTTVCAVGRQREINSRNHCESFTRFHFFVSDPRFSGVWTCYWLRERLRRPHRSSPRWRRYSFAAAHASRAGRSLEAPRQVVLPSIQREPGDGSVSPRRTWV